MKKILMSFVLLLGAVTMSAQGSGVKISAKYKKGDNMLYRATTVTNIQGKTINMVGDTRYVVTKASPDGYTIASTLEKMQTDAAKDDLVGRMMNITSEGLKGIKIILTTDADGKVTGIQNLEEVKEKSKAYVDNVFEELFAELPTDDKFLSMDQLKATAMEQLSEENILNAMNVNPTPFTLNGMTISTGTENWNEDASGMKMKNQYTLLAPDASKIKVASKLEMSKDDFKKYIISQVKKIMPQQAEMIEQNIDMVMDSGAFKIDKTQTADYEFGTNGWMKTITYSTTNEINGQPSDIKAKLELIESNR